MSIADIPFDLNDLETLDLVLSPVLIRGPVDPRSKLLGPLV